MISRTKTVAALLRWRINRLALQLKYLKQTKWRLHAARQALQKAKTALVFRFGRKARARRIRASLQG